MNKYYMQLALHFVQNNSSSVCDSNSDIMMKRMGEKSLSAPLKPLKNEKESIATFRIYFFSYKSN